jgi:FkbM family methyltransferase
MIPLKNLSAHLKSVFEIRRHFRHPWLLVLLRLGAIRMPYFLHEITNGDKQYRMLARPTTTSMADIFVLREVMVEEAYRDVLPLLGKKNIRLVDVGANLGSFTIWMHRTLGVRESHCFEPEPDSFRLLQFNLFANDCRTAKAVECAVGGVARTIHIALKESSPGGTSIYHPGSDPARSRAVPVIAFGEWLRGIEGDFDLLKVDCEGAEWEILEKTDPQEFARFRVFVAEVHDDPEKKKLVSEFKGLMEKLGFRIVRWDNKSQGLYVGVRDIATDL